MADFGFEDLSEDENDVLDQEEDGEDEDLTPEEKLKALASKIEYQIDLIKMMDLPKRHRGVYGYQDVALYRVLM